jgi:hypothetical protein
MYRFQRQFDLRNESSAKSHASLWLFVLLVAIGSFNLAISVLGLVGDFTKQFIRGDDARFLLFCHLVSALSSLAVIATAVIGMKRLIRKLEQQASLPTESSRPQISAPPIAS